MPPMPPIATRWQPGQSGNPAGYSRSRRISDAIEKLLDEDDNLERVAKRWLHAVLSGEDFRYLKELLERTEGKVADTETAPQHQPIVRIIGGRSLDQPEHIPATDDEGDDTRQSCRESGFAFLSSYDVQ